MNISAKGVALIKLEEGLRLQTYKDVCGYSTIGYGHLLKPGESFPNGIFPDQAELMLRADIAEAESIVCEHVTVTLDQGDFDALVDFVFNLGDRLKSSTLLRMLDVGRYDLAEQELLKWDFAGGKPNAALKARRVAEMQLWSLGVDG